MWEVGEGGDEGGGVVVDSLVAVSFVVASRGCSAWSFTIVVGCPSQDGVVVEEVVDVVRCRCWERWVLDGVRGGERGAGWWEMRCERW